MSASGRKENLMRYLAKLFGVTSRRSAVLLLAFTSLFFFLLVLQTVTETAPAESEQYDIYRTLLISKLFAIGLAVVLIGTASWTIFSKDGKAMIEEQENRPEPGFTIQRALKVLFASYGVAIAGFMLTIVLGLMLGDSELIDTIVDKYMFYVMGGITLVAYPWVYRHLK